MIHENDKLNIPERYKKMSVSELRSEKERIYMEIRQKTKETNDKMNYKREQVVFRF